MHRRAFVTRPVRRCIEIFLVAVLGLLVAVAMAQAEMKPVSPFAAPGVAASPPSAFARPAVTPQAQGTLGRVFAWVLAKQKRLQRELAGAVKRLKTGDAFGGAILLAALSFLYGVIHAVGPGHGKAIISSYVVANEQTARRGVLISFIAAAFQAVTAVVLVGVLAVILNAPGLKITAWTNWLESASYALIAVVGLWLLMTQLADLRRRWAGGANDDHQGHDHHHHGHHHHSNGEACDHMVDPKALGGPFSWRKVMAVVFAVGIRPCTGAILVLVFALAQGVFWAGVAAAFAMALGTAITVAVLATLALGSRQLALRLGGASAAWANGVWTVCTIGGSALIFLLGATLFAASLGPARPF